MTGWHVFVSTLLCLHAIAHVIGAVNMARHSRTQGAINAVAVVADLVAVSWVMGAW